MQFSCVAVTTFREHIWCLKLKLKISSFASKVKYSKIRCVWLHILHFEIFQNTRQNGIQRATKYQITFTKLFLVLFLAFACPSYTSISLYSPYFALFVLILHATLSLTRQKKLWKNKQTIFLLFSCIYSFQFRWLFHFSAFRIVILQYDKFSRCTLLVCVWCERQSTVLNIFFVQSFVRRTASFTFTRQFSCVKIATDF